MGRKVSAKERAATEAALDILRTTRNQNLKAQMVKLLFESDGREKARADARQQHRLAHANNKAQAGLQSQLASLKEELTAKQDTITSLNAENEKRIEDLKHEVADKNQTSNDLGEQLEKSQTALSECGRKANEQLSHIASYVGCPEYDLKVLSEYLKKQNSTQSRTAALQMIISDKNLSQSQRRKLAVEITQHHKDARLRQPLKQFVDEVKSELAVASDEDLEPEYARWHRTQESNNPLLLLKVAAGREETSTLGQRQARRMLALFYGWNNVDVPGLDRSHWERQALFDKVSALPKRSIEEVERNLQTNLPAEEDKRSKAD